MSNFFEPGGYPANYFGKGEEFILPDDPVILKEFDARFNEYEIAHPEDPTGDKALEHAKSQPPIKSKLDKGVSTTEEKSPVSEDDKWVELEMFMPARHIELFKKYCSLQRRRPRDIMMLWIDKLCKL